MNSHMIELKIPIEVHLAYDYHGNMDFRPVVLYKTSYVPLMIRHWLQKDILAHFMLTDEEEQDMPLSVERTISFEVEVKTKLVNGIEVGYDAECQTICPGFVAAWIETEALKQFNNQKMTQQVIS